MMLMTESRRGNRSPSNSTRVEMKDVAFQGHLLSVITLPSLINTSEK